MLSTYELSYWEWKTFLTDIDLIVLGGGLVGLQTALAVQRRRPDWKIAILERGPLPIGASTRNAGFACFGSLTELLADTARMSEAEVWSLVERRYRGIQLLQQQFSPTRIELNWCGGYEVFGAEDTESYERCLQARDAVNRRLRPLTGRPETFREADDHIGMQGLSQVAHLLLNVEEGALNPGRLVQELLRRVQAAGILLLTGTEATHVEETARSVTIATRWGWSVTAERLLVATNAFTSRLFPEIVVRPARNQVLIAAPPAGVTLRGCYHFYEGYVYFRDVGDRILIGGGRHLDIAGERTTDFGENSHITAYLHRQLAQWLGLPEAKIPVEHRWTGIIGEGDHKGPLVRSYSDRIVTAVRLSGMGVALSAQVAEEAAGLVEKC